jgi:hypothetical protein
VSRALRRRDGRNVASARAGIDDIFAMMAGPEPRTLSGMMGESSGKRKAGWTRGDIGGMGIDILT